jgi:hypothetical protein
MALFQISDSCLSGLGRFQDDVLRTGPQSRFDCGYMLRLNRQQLGHHAADLVAPRLSGLQDTPAAIIKAFEILLHIFQDSQPGLQGGYLLLASLILCLYGCQRLTLLLTLSL